MTDGQLELLLEALQDIRNALIAIKMKTPAKNQYSCSSSDVVDIVKGMQHD